MSFDQRPNQDQYGDRAVCTGSLKLRTELKVETGDDKGPVPDPLLFGDTCCIPEMVGYFSAMSLATGSYRWRVPKRKSHVPYFRFPNGRVYVTLDGSVYVIDEDTGTIVAKFVDPLCEITTCSERTIFAQHDGGNVLAFSIADGKRLWSFQGPGFANAVLSSSPHVVIHTAALEAGMECRILTLDEHTGSLLAELDPYAIRESDPRFRLLDNWPLQTARKFSVDPIIDDSLMLRYEDGNLVRLRIADLQIVWVCPLSIPGKPQSVICYRDRLYVNFDQGFGSKNFLICVDWPTGRELWRMDEPFTPSGIKNPIMIGKYYIGGAFMDLAAYDVERREFTWRFNDGVSRFGGGLWASGPWMVSRDLVPSNKLHVFSSLGNGTPT